jgi:predicted amino acid racemase
VFGSENSGRVNNLRLGESILLGREALNRNAIHGLHTDAITLVAEVIESKVKPTQPTGVLAQNAFGERPDAVDRGTIAQSILALGSKGVEILGGSSDHLVVASDAGCVAVGSEMTFQLNYSALLRAMTSPFVCKSYMSAFHVSDLRQIA